MNEITSKNHKVKYRVIYRIIIDNHIIYNNNRSNFMHQLLLNSHRSRYIAGNKVQYISGIVEEFGTNT